tara:strand:- start:5870 stop:7078 length:1209 start_codon:yes stop_codon:yes gene_type:complete
MSIYNSSEKIISAIQKVAGKGSKDKPISLHEPYFKDTNAWKYIKDCLDSGWVSSNGEWVNRFENELCTFTGASYAIAVSNGTVALRLSLHLIGIGINDEVIIPPLSFVATANSISHLGAIPHFIDIDSETLGLCPKALEKRLRDIALQKDGKVFNKNTNRQIKAVLPVHVFGLPAKIQEIRSICNRWNLNMIEDAAEALGSWGISNGKHIHCGLFGEIGVISFNGNKLITTGGGGALISNNQKIAEKAKHLSTTAKLDHPWDFNHDEIGWNDRLPNINAALGVSQIEDLKNRLIIKKNIFNFYQEAFNSFNDVEIVSQSSNTISNNWLVTLRFTCDDSEFAYSKRLKLLEIAHSKGILLRPSWKLLSSLPMYSNSPRGNLKIAEDQVNRLINLPSSPQILEV